MNSGVMASQLVDILGNFALNVFALVEYTLNVQITFIVVHSIVELASVIIFTLLILSSIYKTHSMLVAFMVSFKGIICEKT
jgi:hypothetical protein